MWIRAASHIRVLEIEWIEARLEDTRDWSSGVESRSIHRPVEIELMAIDSYRFLDFATRQIMKAWAARQEPGVVPFTPLAKPLRECTVALISTAGIARNDDRPFDQDGERRDPCADAPHAAGGVSTARLMRTRQ